jgi:hypothetical protein
MIKGTLACWRANINRRQSAFEVDLAYLDVAVPK